MEIGISATSFLILIFLFYQNGYGATPFSDDAVFKNWGRLMDVFFPKILYRE